MFRAEPSQRKMMASITKGVIFAIGGQASNQFYVHFPDAARTLDVENETFHNVQVEVKSVRAGSARKFVKFFTNLANLIFTIRKSAFASAD